MSEHYSRPLSFPQHKVRGLTIVNRILAFIVVVSAIAMITLFSMTLSLNGKVKSLASDTESIKRRTLEIKATSWCDQITSENADNVAGLFASYESGLPDVKREIDRQCKKRVSIAQMLAQQSPMNAFDVDHECTVNDAVDGASCTVTVTPRSSTMKKRLEVFSSTTITMRMRVADTPTNLLTDPHVIDNVATMTLDSSGSGTMSFDVPFDISWGTAYDIQVTSYFPNE